MKKSGFTYIMANDRPTLYVGVTNDLIRRVYEHKHNVIEGFTKRYNVHFLVYFEVFDTIEEAIIREKQIKNMKRKEKLNLIERHNPNFSDLYRQILDSLQSPE